MNTREAPNYTADALAGVESDGTYIYLKLCYCCSKNVNSCLEYFQFDDNFIDRRLKERVHS